MSIRASVLVSEVKHAELRAITVKESGLKNFRPFCILLIAITALSRSVSLVLRRRNDWIAAISIQLALT